MPFLWLKHDRSHDLNALWYRKNRGFLKHIITKSRFSYYSRKISDIHKNANFVCCLGVKRKLLWTWLRSLLFVRLNFGKENMLICILENLLLIAKLTPKELARNGRSLDDLARWKETELRLFLLYTVVLRKILPHSLLFHVTVMFLKLDYLSWILRVCERTASAVRWLQ